MVQNPWVLIKGVFGIDLESVIVVIDLSFLVVDHPRMLIWPRVDGGIERARVVSSVVFMGWFSMGEDSLNERSMRLVLRIFLGGFWVEELALEAMKMMIKEGDLRVVSQTIYPSLLMTFGPLEESAGALALTALTTRSYSGAIFEAISPRADKKTEVFSDADDDEMPEIRIYDKSSEKAMKNESGLTAMQEELLQFKLQQVWVLVDLPNGAKDDMMSAILVMALLKSEVIVLNLQWFFNPMETKGPFAQDDDVLDVFCACSRFQVTPKVSHLFAVKRIFKYIKGKPKLGLWYPRESPLALVAYCRTVIMLWLTLIGKSTNWWLKFLGRRLISWQCKKQTIVATSTTEAEYYLELERMLQAQLGHEKGCHLLIGCRLVIVDFLRRSKLRYALTHNPPIYDSLVKQFWQTATARTLADGTQQLNATIDSIEYTITEESVRRQLQLADAQD
ncbi:hypothetical protein Tco_1439693 [Tanacetum coccineum]